MRIQKFLIETVSKTVLHYRNRTKFRSFDFSFILSPENQFHPTNVGHLISGWWMASCNIISLSNDVTNIPGRQTQPVAKEGKLEKSVALMITWIQQSSGTAFHQDGDLVQNSEPFSAKCHVSVRLELETAPMPITKYHRRPNERPRKFSIIYAGLFWWEWIALVLRPSKSQKGQRNGTAF